MTITLRLDFPPAEVQPNARLFWRVKNAHQAAYREICRVDALNARRAAEAVGVVFPLEPPVKARITFILTNKRRRDFDNLIAGFKHAQDGLVDAGLIRDDNVFAFQPQYDVEAGPRAGVVVVLS